MRTSYFRLLIGNSSLNTIRCIVLKLVKFRRFECAEYVARMRRQCTALSVVRRVVGRRPLGKPTSWWNDNIKTDLVKLMVRVELNRTGSCWSSVADFFFCLTRGGYTMRKRCVIFIFCFVSWISSRYQALSYTFHFYLVKLPKFRDWVTHLLRCLDVFAWTYLPSFTKPLLSIQASNSDAFPYRSFCACTWAVRLQVSTNSQ